MTGSLYARGQHAWRRVSRLWFYPTDDTSPDQRKGMRMIWWDGILASSSDSVRNEFIVMFLLALGASETLIGLRSSINSVAALIAPLLGAWLVTRTGKRKLWVLLSGGGLARLCILTMAFIPLLASGDNAVYLFLGLFAVQAFAGALALPPWNSLLGDVCPLPVRGRYLGSKMMFNNIAIVAALPLAGLLLGTIDGVKGFQTLWFISALLGFAATAMYAQVPEPEAAEAAKGKQAGLKTAWRVFLRDRNYMWFCAVHFAWNLGIQLSAPYFAVHMVQTLHFTAEDVALLSTVATVVNIFALRIAGELVDRKGAPIINAISMLLVPLMPLLWIPAKSVVALMLVRCYGSIAWSGSRVADTPLLLMLAPDEYRSEYVAIRNTINRVSMIVGPILAAWVYVQYGFTTNLWASAVLRMAGGLIFLSMLLRGVFRDKDTLSAGRHSARARRAHF